MSADADLPFAWGGPPLQGVLREQPEDFFVDEDLGIAPDGAGEHVFVRVEKRGANTDWVAREHKKRPQFSAFMRLCRDLIELAEVPPEANDYAGD